MSIPQLVTTDRVPADQRFGYWVEEVVPAILPMAVDSADRANGQFWARMQIAGGPMLRMFKVGSSSSTSRYAARDGDTALSRLEHFSHVLAVNLGGADEQPDVLRQYGREASLGNGDCVLADLHGDFANVIGSNNRRLYLWLPAELVDYWLAADNRPVATRIDGSRGWGQLLSTYLRGLAALLDGELKAASEGTYAQVSEHVASLLALAVSGGRDAEAGYGPAQARRRERAQAVMAWIGEHRADPALTATRAAAAFNMSVRQLHRVFAASGPARRTFLDVLHAYRIEAARQLLSDRRCAGLTIGAIGYRCGFADPATFSRVFRDLTGVSPSAYRCRVGVCGED